MYYSKNAGFKSKYSCAVLTGIFEQTGVYDCLVQTGADSRCHDISTLTSGSLVLHLSSSKVESDTDSY